MTDQRMKLTPEKVRAIRSAQGRQKDIAEKFGVCRQHVSEIRRGIKWKRLQ